MRYIKNGALIKLMPHNAHAQRRSTATESFKFNHKRGGVLCPLELIVMPKFRKKPVVIEATQWKFLGDHPNVKEGWIDDKGQIACNVGPAFNVCGRRKIACIKTLEGWHQVKPGDFIITGVHGEEYPCKPDIFEKTYEPVEA